MKPAQRIKIIREVSKNMANNYERHEIDLILRQFDIRTSDYWEEDQTNYIIEMIEYANNEQLIELNNFIKEELEEQSDGYVNNLTKSVAECWEQGDLRLFISHSSKDKKEVAELKEGLTRYKIAAFVAHEDIQPTEEWQEEILCGLETCDAVVAWSTKDFELSAYAQQEIGIAIARRKIIITIRQGIDPVGFTSRQQGIRGNADSSKVALDIVNTLVKKPSLQEKMQNAMLQAFTESWNFDESRRKITYLEKFTTWTPNQLKKLQQSIKTNRQIREAYGIPERINAIVKKFTPEAVKQEILIDDLPF